MGHTVRTIVTALGAGALALGVAACAGETPSGGESATSDTSATATGAETSAAETAGTEETEEATAEASGGESGTEDDGLRGSRTEDEVVQAVTDGLDADTLAGTLARSDVLMIDDKTPEWMTGWEIYQLDGVLGSPRGAVVAIAPDGEVLEIDSRPENLATVFAEYPPADAAEAERRAADFLELSRSMFTWSYQVDSVDDVEWLNSLTDEQLARVDQFTEDYGDVITSPTADEDGEGWTVTVYRVEQDTALEYTVTVGADGEITEEHETIADGLPTPIGL